MKVFFICFMIFVCLFTAFAIGVVINDIIKERKEK